MNLEFNTKKEKEIPFSVRLPEKHYKFIKQLGKKYNVSIAEVIRALIRKALEK